MASRPLSPNARRLRWALLIAVALHALLLWRYAPNLFARFEVIRKAVTSAPPEEQVVDIAELPRPPKGRGMVLSTKLGSGSPEQLQKQLPPGFFGKPPPLAGGSLHLSDDLDFSRASGLQIVANLIPSAVRLPGIKAISDKARTPKPNAGAAAKPAVAQAAQTPVAAPETSPVATVDETPPIPFLPPPVEDKFDVDAAIADAAIAAEKSASTAHSQSASKPPQNLRALLPQGPLIAAAPLPLGGSKAAAAAPPEDGITTFALDAPVARDATRAATRAAPDQGKALAAARQQYFSLLTARLKATNVRMLAEALKAGPRTTVRMSFLVDRDGRVLEISPAQPASRELLERAAAIIRAASLPRVPDAMTQVPLELSFPIEVYR